MNENELKFLCKLMVDNGKRHLTIEEKEIIKKEIDYAQDAFEILVIALNAMNIYK